jgi:hypothetical protein
MSNFKTSSLIFKFYPHRSLLNSLQLESEVKDLTGSRVYKLERKWNLNICVILGLLENYPGLFFFFYKGGV